MSSVDTDTVTEYDVLFYKRAGHSKVHKNKGVSKIDGILSIDCKRKTISLRCAEDGDGEEDHDDSSEDEEKTWKQRRKAASKNGPRGVVYSGKQSPGFAITPQQLEECSTIVLGAFDVEIVGCRSPGYGTMGVTRPTQTVARPASVTPKTLVSTKKSLLLGKRKLVTKPGIVPVIHRKPPPQPRALPPKKTLAPPRVPSQRPPSVLRKMADNVTKKEGALKASSRPIVRPKLVSSFQAPTVASTDSAVLPHIPLPASVRNVLRPHQVEGVGFLWQALTQHKGAILADEMGLGKTLQSIAVVAAWYRTKRAHSHIVVCPSSLVRNWENEFDKWLGKVGQPRRIVIRMGGQDGLHQIRCFAENQSSTKSNRVGQVLIISYDLFRMHTTVIRQAMAGSIGILLVDEGHRLKNTAGSQTMTALESLQADSRLLISASPVQNNLSEFFSLVNFVRPGMLGELSAFRRDFERPIVAANRKNASPAARDLAFRQSRHLEALTKSTILRRLQADILARTLPPRTEILLFCKLSAEQIRLYQSATTSRAPNMAFAESLEILTNLRKVCTHPLLLGGNGEATLSSSGKLEVLSSLLVEMRRSADNNKVVVVSNFTSALSLIEELILKPNNMTYLRLDGNVPAQKRQEIVDMFNKTSASRSFCFLLSAKAGGCGLNLVGANNLVLFEPDWNPSTDLQCMGRVYRTGQRRPTTIYRLFSTGTLEEIIYQRQLHKGELASITVDGRGEQKAVFSSEELKECMTLKLRTLSDTKDKIGGSWPDSNKVVSSLVANPDTTWAQAAADLVTCIRIVDHSSDSLPSSRGTVDRMEKKDDVCEKSDDATSEEEFVDDAMPVSIRRFTPTTPLDGSENDDEEYEFE